MSLLGKIKTLISQNDTDSTVAEIDTEGFTPETLDTPPDYTFVDVMCAARQGNLEKVKKYLNFNQNYAFCKSWDDNTLLHEAAHFARADIVTLLLDQGADLNAFHKGQLPLHFAIEGDSREIANKSADEFLEYKRRRKETVKSILDHHADITLPNENGEQAIHLAAKSGHHELVALLLEQDTITVDTLTVPQNGEKTGRTPLLLAIRYHKDPKTIQLLLERGTNPNHPDPASGWVALHYIAGYRDPAGAQHIKESHLKAFTELLIKHQADVNQIADDSERETPLHLAIQQRHMSVVETLLQHGADLHIENARGMMVTGMAARDGDAELVAYLWDKGADVYKSRALFHAASCLKNHDVMELLLSRGIDVNMPDRNGYTPIFAAISAHSVANVKYLLDKGIDTAIHSPKGRTVLEHAYACWGEVEDVSGEDISAERKQKANNARQVIELLGGFKRPPKPIL